MEQGSSREANSHWASQEIPCLLWNQNFHYHVHKSPPLVPILIHINPVHTSQFYFSIIHSNIILPRTPSLQGVSSLQVFLLTFCMNLSFPRSCYMPRPSHPLWFYHHNTIWSSSLCTFFPPFCHHFLPLSFSSPHYPVLTYSQRSSCSVRATFHSHSKQHLELCFVYFNI